MTNQAHHAVRAAKHYPQWGAYATRRYIEKNNIPVSLYWLARDLEIRSSRPCNH